MITKRSVSVAIVFFVAGAMFGICSTVLLRVVTADRHVSAGHAEQEGLIGQVIKSPDLGDVEAALARDPSSVNDPQYGLLPLLAAVSLWPDNLELASLLIEAGADPAVVSRESIATRRHSALSYCAWMGNRDMLQLLLDSLGAGPFAPETALEVKRSMSIVNLEHPELYDVLDWPSVD